MNCSRDKWVGGRAQEEADTGGRCDGDRVPARRGREWLRTFEWRGEGDEGGGGCSGGGDDDDDDDEVGDEERRRGSWTRKQKTRRRQLQRTSAGKFCTGSLLVSAPLACGGSSSFQLFCCLLVLSPPPPVACSRFVCDPSASEPATAFPQAPVGLAFRVTRRRHSTNLRPHHHRWRNQPERESPGAVLANSLGRGSGDYG